VQQHVVHHINNFLHVAVLINLSKYFFKRKTELLCTVVAHPEATCHYLKKAAYIYTRKQHKFLKEFHIIFRAYK
ncbi:hypothetical protein ACJX0J_030670, partial [Zea mays]